MFAFILNAFVYLARGYMMIIDHLVHVFEVHDSILILEVVPHGEHDVVLENKSANKVVK